MGAFDDILKQVPAEDQAVFSKYPQLKAAVDQMETEFTQVSRYAGDWVGWQKENWDPNAGTTREAVALRNALAVAEAKLTTATTSGASGAEIAKLRTDLETKLADTQKQSMAAIEGMNLFYRAAASKLLPHQKEFGDNLDPQDLMAFMQKNSINDPDIAYDKMVAGRRAELATKHQTELEAKHTADIAAAEQRGREARSQEIAMGPSGVLPTDNSGGIAGVTAYMGTPQKAGRSAEEQAIYDAAKPGDGSLARLGYQKYVRGEYAVQ